MRSEQHRKSTHTHTHLHVRKAWAEFVVQPLALGFVRVESNLDEKVPQQVRLSRFERTGNVVDLEREMERSARGGERNACKHYA